MSRVLIDTSILSYLLKFDTRADLYRKHIEGRTPGIAFMTVAEVYFWAEKYRWGARRRANVDAMLRSYVVIRCDDAPCISWARIRHERERQRRPISHADTWIAACAHHYDARLRLSPRFGEPL